MFYFFLNKLNLIPETVSHQTAELTAYKAKHLCPHHHGHCFHGNGVYMAKAARSDIKMKLKFEHKALMWHSCDDEFCAHCFFFITRSVHFILSCSSGSNGFWKQSKKCSSQLCGECAVFHQWSFSNQHQDKLILYNQMLIQWSSK